VAHQLLYFRKVPAFVEQMRGKTVAKSMHSGFFLYPRAFHRFFESVL
jgi:hypothetical protein